MIKRLRTADETTSKPSFLAIICSILAALFGVQSERNRQRDFKHGSPAVFITVGAIFIVLFVLTLILIVNWVLPSS